MSFQQFREIQSICEEENRPVWEVVCRQDCGERQVSEKESFETMRGMYAAMRQADEGYRSDLRSLSKMAGGDGAKLQAYREKGDPLMGPFLSEVIEKAVKMGESNACMRRIVAAPTAGSCGVIPAVLLTWEKYRKPTEERMVQSLFVAGGIGEVLAESAGISGAQGGCQAEIGSASAMAAGAVAWLEGGDSETIFHAAALALKSFLGLTCDPVAGLVEIPCIKRNAAGAVMALTAAQMSLAGVRSRIPPDEVVNSMRRIGRQIPEALRETSEGGLALTPTGRRVREQMNAAGDLPAGGDIDG